MSLEKFDDRDEFIKAFEQIRPEYFLPDTYTEEQKQAVVQATSPAKTRASIVSSIPMICKSDKCVFASICPLQKEGVAPRGYQCPYEVAMVGQFMSDYMEELDVDPGKLSEVSMIRDLVDIEVQTLRKTKVLSMDDFIVENVVGISSEGEPILKKELHQAVELDDRLLKRKQMILKQLLATRESKAKVGMGVLDKAQWVSNMNQELRQIEIDKDRAIRAKLGVAKVDEYIDAEVVDEEED